MRIKILGIEDCPYCKKAKWLSTMPGLAEEVVYATVSRDQKPEIIALIGKDYETYPVVLIDDEYIGGFNELNDKVNSIT